MPYTPDEYENFKAFYKEALQKRRAFTDFTRITQLRQKAEWHLSQMQTALEALGYTDPAEPLTPDQPLTEPAPASNEPPKTLF
jgi:hypothetical protein